MRNRVRRFFVAALGLVLSLSALAPAGAQQRRTTTTPRAAASNSFNVPVTYYKLPNGLKVVLSQDTSAPTVAIAVYYQIGFRVEPRERTGFAHLFEHMMFQGSQNLGKLEFIRLVQQNGGIMNGSTRFDFTNYFEIMPAHKLETGLWAEADRMRGLSITEENLKNQQGVVSNEVKVGVLNAPYGGFPWLDMPQYANTNWYNAHNFYGDLEDIEAAKLEEVQQFFKTYYAPNNAALVIVGDFNEGEARAMIEKYFAGIPSAKVPAIPDLSEPRQETERNAVKQDALAKQPALSFAYHMPPRNTPEYYAMGLLDQLLVQGHDSLLNQELVQRRGYADTIQGGTNVVLGNMYNYQGPMLWMAYLYHDNKTKPEEIMSAVDTVIKSVQDKPVDRATLDRALIKVRSNFYDILGQLNGFGRADLLACFALFDDDPARINKLEAEFRKVTPQVIQRTAREYLRPTNRTVLKIVPKTAS